MTADHCFRLQKCDAAKPHCSTCVRSYRHLLRTAPKSDPVLSCEYEDGTKNDNAGSDGSPEDYADANKKKRKISTDSGKKKEEDDTEALRKRIGMSGSTVSHTLLHTDSTVYRVPRGAIGPKGDARSLHAPQ